MEDGEPMGCQPCKPPSSSSSKPKRSQPTRAAAAALASVAEGDEDADELLGGDSAEAERARARRQKRRLSAGGAKQQGGGLDAASAASNPHDRPMTVPAPPLYVGDAVVYLNDLFPDIRDPVSGQNAEDGPLNVSGVSTGDMDADDGDEIGLDDLLGDTIPADEQRPAFAQDRHENGKEDGTTPPPEATRGSTPEPSKQKAAAAAPPKEPEK